jgi:hypothetical protein
MKFTTQHIALIASSIASISASYTGTPLANSIALTVGEPMGAPVDLNGPGEPHMTHRRNDMLNEVLGCQFNAANFMASHDGDMYAIGVSDFNTPFGWNGGAACGQCYLFEHKNGNSAIGVGADLCGMDRGCQGMFDVADLLQTKLIGSLEDNLQNKDVTVTPVACKWPGAMRYVLLNTSAAIRWYVHIQQSNVPIKAVKAIFTHQGKTQEIEAKKEAGKWSIFFPSGNGDIGKEVTLEITGINDKVVRDTIVAKEFPAIYDERDLTALSKLPFIQGKAQF